MITQMHTSLFPHQSQDRNLTKISLTVVPDNVVVDTEIVRVVMWIEPIVPRGWDTSNQRGGTKKGCIVREGNQ